MTDKEELKALILALQNKGYYITVQYEDITGNIDTINVNGRLWYPIAFAEKYRPIAKIKADFRKIMHDLNKLQLTLKIDGYKLTSRALNDINIQIENIKASF